MSGQYQAALYLGDVSERVRILKNCGQSEHIVPLIIIVMCTQHVTRFVCVFRVFGILDCSHTWAG